VGAEADAHLAVEMGAEGIGLLRTEFLFSERLALPDEQEQVELYTAILAAIGPSRGPVIIRTLDAGADKPLPSLATLTGTLPAETNPVLGVRGIRLHLAAPELLSVQLRAIVLAGAATGTSVHIMLPMIATVEEVRAVRTLLIAARATVAARGVSLHTSVPLGIMVETPAAVLSIETLAREAAFFSIGTNDLTQYVMAADRLNPQLAALCKPTQPAVLRAIAAVARAARKTGRHVGVCGEMAGDPRLAPLLVGLGIEELSMNPASIPRVKEALAARTRKTLTTLAERTLRAATVDEVEALVSDTLGQQ
jgi:phosphoenolpyruvate-protein kinase (PTS system EI component)